MIFQSPDIGAFEFVAVAVLRAAQLARGCVVRVEGNHSTAVFAQLEVAQGKVKRIPDPMPEPAAKG